MNSANSPSLRVDSRPFFIERGVSGSSPHRALNPCKSARALVEERHYVHEMAVLLVLGAGLDESPPGADRGHRAQGDRAAPAVSTSPSSGRVGPRPTRPQTRRARRDPSRGMFSLVGTDRELLATRQTVWVLLPTPSPATLCRPGGGVESKEGSPWAGGFAEESASDHRTSPTVFSDFQALSVSDE